MKRKLRKKALDRNYESILQSENCTFIIKQLRSDTQLNFKLSMKSKLRKKTFGPQLRIYFAERILHFHY